LISALDDLSSVSGDRVVGRIPVHNLWLLMLYASDLTSFRGAFDALVEEDAANIPELIARLLTQAVELRLKRNLTRDYHQLEKTLTRVRGRINLLTTASRQLLFKGEVFCRFDELTIDTPRNRLVRAALDLMTRLVRNNDLSHRCRSLAATLGRAGVVGKRPSRAELAADQIGRNDASDRFMIALARLAFDLALPTEDAGATALAAPDREEAWVRRLFEKAVLGFARVDLEPLGCSVRGSIPMEWQVSSGSAQIATILPRMVSDIVIDFPDVGKRLVIDTKFTSILGTSRFGNAKLKSGYLYQMYAYLRSQEGSDERWNSSAGLFLHPSVGTHLYEHVEIQEHSIGFATIDLAGPTACIRSELQRFIRAEWQAE